MTETRRAGPLFLAVGIVALEFAAAVTGFVASSLLPIVAADLDARNDLGLLIAGSTLGLFVALPLASRVLGRLGPRGTLAAGMAAYLGGLLLAATARTAWMFALGQFSAGLASGLLAIFGISSAIRHLDDRLRIRVVAAASAMWIVPALVGPAATLGLEQLVGWRWTLLVPVPFVLFGRLLVVRAARGEPSTEDGQRPLAKTLTVPLGAALVVFSGGSWPLALAGAAITVAGMIAILPAGTARLRPGTPAALGAMVLFAIGYFGADSLITVLLTSGFGVSLGQAAIVLSAAPLGWAVTSLVAAKFTSARFPVVGLGMTALGTAVLTFGGSFATALAAWAVAGIGVGLAYPGLYIRATTAGSSGFTAAELATAVITAECVGQLLGRAVGGALSSSGTGLFASYALFAASLAAAAYAAARRE
ncbi:Predicted arabinose efflux permease, MFS family [Amycolatopsis lurida]|uniref:MFS transporter n=1 Tax=Amycolatopsis lurida NRRL 2430 TaxID=1460371 RepID=A0A2P2G1H8_AMYLU|nr:MFS transporter [Amycolatopsis lurida]KFU82822.1 MFS transporter [Amycolatopsis lurida NRRL 2430]SEE01806.1 Predicted arabinose efflux permease, MFS family [Amycolatopsis lurida]